MHDITVRRMQFDFPRRNRPGDHRGRTRRVVLRCSGLSLLLPYLEPYLIRTMNEAKKRIDDPDLLKDLERFNAQEGQHYRQHRRFNEAVRMSGFPQLAELEAELDADYRRFSEERSLQFNLAYAEGFEALTTATARLRFRDQPTRALSSGGCVSCSAGTWSRSSNTARSRSKCTTTSSGTTSIRLRWGLYAQRHMFSWIKRVALSIWRSRAPR